MSQYIGLYGPQELIAWVLFVVVLIVPFWKIYSKAGYPGALSLLMMVPLVNLVVLFVVAFADWPVLRELRGFKQKAEITPR